jgi:formate dehydrogenase subunit delta
METRDMVRMANQIAEFFKSYSETEALEGIADHFNKFWDPSMRKDLFAYIDKGGKDLAPLVITASSNIKRPKIAA